ncbi:glycosyltransferase family 2 protein [Diaphorobacter sp. HDW4A]|uniref:glycosyltransferase family 2 protein n=1 Tax=Diaphorobacter sp. HDW4A TaxID=2714924 RepID=UPI0014092CC8|nr:glycosyltransferase [Diaphorobacter sp. HDW4A]QIL82159.1 glycosyltransferase family 2 protein [Diaphorobacter sp. HDW4A]
MKQNIVRAIWPESKPKPMQISCLMVTQASRFEWVQLAVADFCAQTYAERDLLIIHDSGTGFDDALKHWIATASACAKELKRIAVKRVPAGQTLGALRNQSVQMATGDLVCQWDDDDRYHPMRLALQAEKLRAADADFCFLRDQLHGFVSDKTLCWDDWNVEPYPLNFVQGTLLGKRDKMPRYPEIERGEDTGLCLAILNEGHRVTRLRHHGWCYIYTFHGDNVWGDQHHQSISSTKRMPLAFVVGKSKELRARLAEYINLPGYQQILAGNSGIPVPGDQRG